MNAAPATRARPRDWAGLAVLALPTMLLGLDVTVLYQALPMLSVELRPTTTETLWIMDVYGFLIAGLLITMGSLGDRYGHRRLLVIGSLAFGVTSVLAAFAPSAGLLIAARAALGVAGATLMPATLALIRVLFPDGRQRAVAIGVWATMFALGMAAGPVVGGVVLAHFWWGAAFLLAVPITALVVALAPLMLPDHRDDHGGPLDLPSVVLSLAAILPVVYTVKHVADTGVDGVAVVALVAGAVAAVLFVRRQRRLPRPLLDVSLFANRTLGAALTVLLLGLVSVGGVMFLVTQYLQLVDDLTPLVAGAWLGPPALLMFVAAIAAPLLARRVRPGWVVAGTLAASAVGQFLLSQVEGPGEAPLVVTGFGLVYLGLGAIAALGTDLVVSAAPPEKAGSAAALSETVQELGVAAGVALLGSLATAVYRDRISAELPGHLPAPVEAALRENLADASSASPGPELLAQAKLAFTSGLTVTATVACVLTIALAALAATVLRHSAPTGAEQEAAPAQR
ncbi:MFS transporter [Saccharomonospora piscinae]|uniref:MFS transporter n=1 Tax=Saccharomonospora piscinae TaxID=687388 RepID=UPI0004630632